MAHLSSEQRYTIAQMKNKAYSRKEICLVIGKDKSVLSRELVRNSDARNGEYKAELAHKKYRQRQTRKPKKQYFTVKIRQAVEAGLQAYLSPEQIVGLAKRENRVCVSVERIYQYIWSDKKREVIGILICEAKGKNIVPEDFLRTKGGKYWVE